MGKGRRQIADGRKLAENSRTTGADVNLIWKFNAALIAIFAVGFTVAGFVANSVLQNNAREEVLQHARLLIEAA